MNPLDYEAKFSPFDLSVASAAMWYSNDAAFGKAPRRKSGILAARR